MWLLLNKQNHVFGKLRQDKKWFVWEMGADLLGLLQLFPSVIWTKPLQINRIHACWALLPTQRGSRTFPPSGGKAVVPRPADPRWDVALSVAQPLPVPAYGKDPLVLRLIWMDLALMDSEVHLKSISCCSPIPRCRAVCLHLSSFPCPGLFQPEPSAPCCLVRQPHPSSRLFLLMMPREGLSSAQEWWSKLKEVNTLLSFLFELQNDYSEIKSIMVFYPQSQGRE